MAQMSTWNIFFCREADSSTAGQEISIPLRTFKESEGPLPCSQKHTTA